MTPLGLLRPMQTQHRGGEVLVRGVTTYTGFGLEKPLITFVINFSSSYK